MSPSKPSGEHFAASLAKGMVIAAISVGEGYHVLSVRTSEPQESRRVG